jgi:hypothetical protein
LRAIITAPLALAIGLSGCAPIYLAGKYNYDEGWREAVVTHLVLGEEIEAHATRDCRLELSAERTRPSLFARVRFNNGRNRFSRIVPLAAQAAVAAGDVVLVKINDCSQPAVVPGPH